MRKQTQRTLNAYTKDGYPCRLITVGPVTMNVTEWCKHLGCSVRTIHKHLNMGEDYFADFVSRRTKAKETLNRREETTADMVAVVRCMDCVHKGSIQEPCHGNTVDYCRFHDIAIRNSDYCSYGEKRENK